MTPYQLQMLCLHVHRSTVEGEAVYQWIQDELIHPPPRGIEIMDEWIRPFLEGTAELATLADRLKDVENPPAGEWLAIAKEVSGLLKRRAAPEALRR